MEQKTSHYHSLILLGIIILSVWISQSGIFSAKNPYESIWKKPQTSGPVDLSKSATCNFNKDVNAFYNQDASKSETQKNIHYVVSNDDGTNPVILTDLDTDTPHVHTNTGDSPLLVINNDAASITLIAAHTSDLNRGDTVVYRLFKQDGVLVYIDTHSGLIGPTGTMEMGYCQ